MLDSLQATYNSQLELIVMAEENAWGHKATDMSDGMSRPELVHQCSQCSNTVFQCSVLVQCSNTCTNVNCCVKY